MRIYDHNAKKSCEASSDDHRLLTDGGRPDEDMERLEELYGLPADHIDEEKEESDD